MEMFIFFFSLMLQLFSIITLCTDFFPLSVIISPAPVILLHLLLFAIHAFLYIKVFSKSKLSPGYLIPISIVITCVLLQQFNMLYMFSNIQNIMIIQLITIPLVYSLSFILSLTYPIADMHYFVKEHINTSFTMVHLMMCFTKLMQISTDLNNFGGIVIACTIDLYSHSITLNRNPIINTKKRDLELLSFYQYLYIIPFLRNYHLYNIINRSYQVNTLYLWVSCVVSFIFMCVNNLIIRYTGSDKKCEKYPVIKKLISHMSIEDPNMVAVIISDIIVIFINLIILFPYIIVDKMAILFPIYNLYMTLNKISSDFDQQQLLRGSQEYENNDAAEENIIPDQKDKKKMVIRFDPKSNDIQRERLDRLLNRSDNSDDNSYCIKYNEEGIEIKKHKNHNVGACNIESNNKGTFKNIINETIGLKF
jgi:hypothetical protein